MRIRSRALFVVAALLVTAWILSASLVRAAVDSTGRRADRPQQVDPAAGLESEESAKSTPIAMARGTAVPAPLTAAPCVASVATRSAPRRMPCGAIGPRAPPATP